MRESRAFWPLLAIALAVYPVAGVFSTTRVFVLRDLVMVFWPKYVWLRRTVWSGQWPWWDPHVAGGQSAAADALNQLFLLPTMALRLLLPEPIGFNLWVALPFPLAALGTYLYARRYGSRAAAALGAVTFAVSGPVVSTGNFPNLSWSMLAIPWLLWAVDRLIERPTARRFAAVALIAAGQACAGEPVTLVATGALLVTYVLAAPSDGGADGGLRRRMRLTAATIGALAWGAALAAVQLWPLWAATRRSLRADAMVDGSYWSVHPLGLLETIAPTLFGNFFVSFSVFQPWMTTLNSGRDPFFYSLYVGIPLLLLGAIGVITSSQPRRTRFWLAIGLAALIASFGSHTPIYPMLQQYVPLIGTFRYPAKYLVFTCIALAMLAVEGWSTFERLRAADDAAQADDEAQGEASRAVNRHAARWLILGLGLPVAVAAYVAAAVTLLGPDLAARTIYRVARAVGLPNPVAGVGFMLPELPAHAARLVLLSVIATGLLALALSRRPEARRAQWVLYGLIAADLAFTNGPINPTARRELIQTPAWATLARQAPHDRVYFGGRLVGGLHVYDPDAPDVLTLPPVDTLLDTRVVMSTRTAFTPSGVGAREMVSFDLTAIWPREYSMVMEPFAAATRDQRLAWLRRTGVRYCIVHEPVPAGATVLARLPNFEDMAMFECDPDAARAVVVSDARVVANVDEQKRALFLEDGGRDLLMLLAPPPAASGQAGAPVSSYARFRRDDPTVVELEAGAPADGGYLILRDTYAPGWRVEVDGQPAEVRRANLLFRAVRLAPGAHVVRFEYRPTALVGGAALSACATLGLAVLVSARRRTSAAPTEAPIVRAAHDHADVDAIDTIPAADARGR